ncbi:fimbrial protein [Lysobacter sp. FW306-1B-D06B]|uniref:fimbrial protein n=1 Tax=Lysobacter sp. FW306-1B-D06B TaxID=3140250 RepID=UPI003140A7DD
MNYMNQISVKSEGCWVRRLMPLLAMFLLSSNASADCLTVSAPADHILAFPAHIAVPRDAPDGMILATARSPAITNYWECKPDALMDLYQVTFMTPLVDMYAEGVDVPGIALSTANVFKTSVPGVGLVLGIRATSGCRGMASWGEIHGYASTEWTPIGGCYARAMDAVNVRTPLGAEVVAMLVKWGAIQPGIVDAVQGALMLKCKFGNAPTIGHTPFIPFCEDGAAVSYHVGTSMVSLMACETPDVIVDLGSHLGAVALPSVGSSTPSVAFRIDMRNCSTGLGMVDYRIEPTSAVLDLNMGIVGLDGVSTASGVGVQLLDDTGAAHVLNEFIPVVSYSSETGGAASIPLKARYYRTDDVTPGSANATMLFTMRYQ